MTNGLNKKEYALLIRAALQNSIPLGGELQEDCLLYHSQEAQKKINQQWTNFTSKDDLKNVIDFINPNKTIFFD